MDIKKIIKNIYKFDLSQADLEDGYEMVTIGGVNEFVSNFKKRDIDNGIIVTPTGYSRGLIYKTTNNGEFYNNPEWYPDVISFSLDIFGLKKNSFYKLTVVSRNTRKYNSITDSSNNRMLDVVTNGEEVLLHQDVSEFYENTEFTTVFRANSTEAIMLFSIGKIYINNIIIDEIEIYEDSHEEEPSVVMMEGKTQVVAYGIFDMCVSGTGRYVEAEALTGKGIRLFYDNTDKCYILERDNVCDTIQNAFTNIEYTIDFNTNKLPLSDNFDRLIVTKIDSGISPNMLKQGYMCFSLLNKTGEKVSYKDIGRLAIFIHKIY